MPSYTGLYGQSQTNPGLMWKQPEQKTGAQVLQEFAQRTPSQRLEANKNRTQFPVRLVDYGTVAPAATSGVNYGSGSTARQTGLDSNGQVDYSTLIRDGIAAGVDPMTIQGYQAQRDAKIALAGGSLDQYKDDAVSAAARAYIAGHPATPRYPVQYDSYQDFYDQGGYQEAMDAQQQLLDAKLAQIENAYSGQRGTINQSAEDQARQAYINYLKAQDRMPQAIAASGYSGGLADSQQLDLELGYQNNHQQILQQRDQALDDVYTALNNARLQTSIEGAQEQSALMQQAVAAYQNWVAQQNAYANKDYWTQYDYTQQQAQQNQDFQNQLGLLDRQQQNQLAILGQQHQWDLDAQDQEMRLQGAQLQTQYGQGLTALGQFFKISPETIAAMDAYDQQQKAKEDADLIWNKKLDAWAAQNPELYEMMGGNGTYLRNMQSANLAAAQRTGTSRGGYYQPNNTPTDPYSYLAANGVTDEGAAFALLLGKGYSKTEAETLAKYYVDSLTENNPFAGGGPASNAASYASLLNRIEHISPGVTPEAMGSLANEIDRAYTAGTITEKQYNELGRMLGYQK